MIASIFLAACTTVLPGWFFQWDPPPPDVGCTPGVPVAVAWYDVERETLSTHTIYKVGSTQAHGDPLVAEWCAAEDDPPPRAGTTYRYRVRAVGICSPDPTHPDPYPCDCGPSEAYVDLCGAPLACFTDQPPPRHEVQCYVGDPLLPR